MMYFKRFNNSGSLSLTTMFSTASGVLFVLLFYNLSSYVGSRGAVTETARVTARCITPTDPECVTLLPSNPDAIEFDWFGRILEKNITADLNVRTFNYKASMPSELWKAHFNYYTTNIGEQRFSINSELVPVKTFSATGAYEIPSGLINATYSVSGSSEFSPLFNPNFPAFEQDRVASVDNWLSSQSPYNYNRIQSSEVTIEPKDNYVFITPSITVPEIPSEPGAICTGSCNTHQLAGGNNASWKDYAYVAIKAISKVKSERNQTSIKWGESNRFAGLEIEIKDKNGQIVSWKPEGTNLNLDWRCLGGADELEVGTSWTGYNLWLRGPAGANGGNASSAVCPGGVYDHDSIIVPRGGSFRIRTHLVNTGNNKARAEVTVLTYFDQYANTTRTNKLVECLAKPYTGYDQETAACSLEQCIPTNCAHSYCPNQSLKSLSNAQIIKITPLSCSAQRQAVSYSCSENTKTIPNSAKTLQTLSVAICSDSWRPAVNNSSITNQNSICSWQAGNISSWQEVGGTVNCELAKTSNNSGLCETPFTENSQANIGNCKNLETALNSVSENTKLLNATQTLGAPKFQNLASFNFKGLENIRSANFWTNKDLQGNTLSGEQKKETVSGYRTFIKIDGSAKAPNPNDFISLIQSLNINAYNWDDFLAHKDSLISPEKISTEDYDLSEVYPFNEQVTEEIYYGQTDPSAGWDFQADCNIDSDCSCKDKDSECKFKTYPNLELMLRDYAAKQVPQAADLNYAFNASATHIGYKEIGKYQANSLLEFPTCFPFRAVCSKDKSANDSIVYLGKSSIRPQACDNYSECFSRVPENTNFELSDPEIKIDLDLAKQAGMNELKKIVPFATLKENCGDIPACAEIKIDTSSQSRAIVQVKYNIPLSFPLSSILQKDSIQIIHEKQEVIERDFAGGRFFRE